MKSTAAGVALVLRLQALIARVSPTDAIASKHNPITTALRGPGRWGAWGAAPPSQNRKFFKAKFTGGTYAINLLIKYKI